MPTYEYQCRACGHRFEHFQSMTSRKRRKCPACGKPRLTRLVGAGAGLIFKGSGFYETDYKRKSSGGSSGGEPSGGDAKPKAGAKDEAGGSDAEASKKAGTDDA